MVVLILTYQVSMPDSSDYIFLSPLFIYMYNGDKKRTGGKNVPMHVRSRHGTIRDEIYECCGDCILGTGYPLTVAEKLVLERGSDRPLRLINHRRSVYLFLPSLFIYMYNG